ncbi:MAG: bifunctional adenosylcobinamide kinase/adenosylcobinamide-phosphate guanylyltransferase [Treponema sp.]|nr:bifunctional adenosylcobinamide kinase/adenosylcobinamide-phosphate guanylyltransferase [Treponema sp.]
MILILGGAHSGRHAFFDTLGITAEDCRMVTADDAHRFAEEKKVATLSSVCVRLSSFRVVIATEMGLGIIPLEKKDRVRREENGRLNIALASLSDCVVLMTAGIPRVIKGNLSSTLKKKTRYLMVFRHGATEANLLRRYAGAGTDIDLCDEGKKQVERTKKLLTSYAAEFPVHLKKSLLEPEIVYVSPMRRCVQTAEILYPRAKKQIVPDFREMDFGLFENRSADELLSDDSVRDLYREFIDSGGTISCPPSVQSAGESVAQFSARSAMAFRRILAEKASGHKENGLVTVVAHGGTQMSLFSQFCAWTLGDDLDGAKNPYFDWQTDCGGFRLGAVK